MDQVYSEALRVYIMGLGGFLVVVSLILFFWPSRKQIDEDFEEEIEDFIESGEQNNLHEKLDSHKDEKLDY